MKENYRQILPKWFEEQNDFELVLSDDLDSLLSCALLKKIKGWKVRYFYDFEHLYRGSRSTKDKEQRVWVDIAVNNDEKAFDNHVSMLTLEDHRSKNMINPNLLCYICNDNYEDKYAGSTALLIWSLYDVPLPISEEGKMLLLCIDSSYKGYYNSRFRGRSEFFLQEVLGFNELLDVLARHTEEEFEEFIIRYGIKKKIKIKNGEIATGLDVDAIGNLLGVDFKILDADQYEMIEEYEISDKKITTEKTVRDICRTAFSLALTYKNSVRYSVVKQEKKEETDMEWINRFKSATKKKLIF